MRCLVLLLAVGVALAYVPKTRVSRSTLPSPEILRATTLDPAGFKVEWKPVQSPNPDDPVIGYKVKVWEVPPVRTYKYKVIDGKQVLIQELAPPKDESRNITPDTKPAEYITSSSVTSQQVDGIKVNVPYHIRVLAFTKTTEGPLSSPVSVELLDDDKNDKDAYVVT